MFTDEEAAVYDRQIRLWGIHAQQKIRSADVLVIGLSGVATEVVKNLVLSGINSITLVDNELVTDLDMLSNLFTRNQVGSSRADAVQKYVQELNPRVMVKVKNCSPAEILSECTENNLPFIGQFHVVVAINQDQTSTIELNKVCNSLSIPFFSAWAFGSFSMVFCDLGLKHGANDKIFIQFDQVIKQKSFVPKDTKIAKRKLEKIRKYKSVFLIFLTMYRYHEKNGNFPNVKTEDDTQLLSKELQQLETELVEELNNTLTDDIKWNSLDGWHSKIWGQFAFTTSIVGGFMSQDIIRSVTKENIDFNFFLFDGLGGHTLDIGY